MHLKLWITQNKRIKLLIITRFSYSNIKYVECKYYVIKVLLQWYTVYYYYGDSNFQK